MKLPKLLILPVLLGAMGAQAFLPYPERQLKYPRVLSWDSKIPPIWSGWKTRFVINGLVQANDPSQNKKPVSEGQSYGMLLSVWMGDQAMFNQIWAATETKFWKGQWYSWDGNDPNYAGDADIDIAGALIFASALVDAGHWTNYSTGGNTYKAKAKIVLASVMKNLIDKNANYRVNSWPDIGDNARNPSYHMPQWYPIFKEFAAANSMEVFDWDAATKGAYDFLEAQPNAQYGMARNFSRNDGSPASAGISTPSKDEMGFDAIRVPYRIGMAAIWYKQARALAYADKVWKNGKVSAKQAGMYSVSSAAIWGWDPPQYEKFMPRSMWGTLAQGSRNVSVLATAKADSLITQVVPSISGQTFIQGEDSDTTKATSPNRNYYAQSLGLMGVLAMAGRAWNVWDDLKNPWVVPDTATQVVSPLTATPSTIPVAVAGNIQKSKITITLSKPIRWTLRLTGRTSKANYDTIATSSIIELNWSSNMRVVGSTERFVAEIVDVRLIYAGGDSARASQKTTITLTPSVAVGPRAVRGDGNPRRVDAGWLLQDPTLAQGVWVKATVRDLNGRVVRSISLNDVTDAGSGLLIPSPADAMPTMLELESGSGLAPRRYLLRPAL
jgi:endo-1,4-beta-D-glucanase Y